VTVALLATAALGAGACNAILGIEDLSGDGLVDGGAGGASSASSSSSSSSGGVSCVAETECYFGPEGTQDVGVCKAGVCDAEGTSCSDVRPRAEVCVGEDMVDENCDEVTACTGEGTWSKAGQGPDTQNHLVLAVEPEGSVYVAGAFTGSFSWPGANELTTQEGMEGRDVFLTHFDADGDHIFSFRFGDAADQEVTGIAADATGVVIVGTFKGAVDFGGGPLQAAGGSSGFVARFAPDGKHAWSRILEGAAEVHAEDVALDKSSHVIVGGSYQSTLELETGQLAGTGGGFVAQLAGDTGVALWATPLGNQSPSNATVRRVAVTTAGDVVLAGHFTTPFAIVGPTLDHTNPGGGSTDVFAARVSGINGAPIAAEAFGSLPDDTVKDIAASADDGFVLAMEHTDVVTVDGDPTAGPLDGSIDTLIVKLETEGTGFDAPWTIEFGANGEQSVGGIAVDGAGNLVMTGAFDAQIGDLTPVGGLDLYIVKFGPLGEEVWYWDIGGEEQEIGLAVGTDAAGNIFVGGAYDGTIDELVPGIPPADVSASAGDLFLLERQP
jgi:hypothetical protein